MSNILKRTRDKRKDLIKYQCITFNFANVNRSHLFFGGLLISILIGLFYHSDVYSKYNKLPEDRNELTPIKESVISFGDDCIMKGKLEINSISKSTFNNLYENINIKVIFDKGLPFVVSTKNADSVYSTKHSLLLSQKINRSNSFQARFHLFDSGFGDTFNFTCK